MLDIFFRSNISFNKQQMGIMKSFSQHEFTSQQCWRITHKVQAFNLNLNHVHAGKSKSRGDLQDKIVVYDCSF